MNILVSLSSELCGSGFNLVIEKLDQFSLRTTGRVFDTMIRENTEE